MLIPNWSTEQLHRHRLLNVYCYPELYESPREHRAIQVLNLIDWNMNFSKNTKQLILAIFFIAAKLCANGGPYEITALRELGEIRLANAAGVQLLEEDLSFKIQGDTVFVRVQYTLENLMNEDAGIDYAFPVDFWRMNTVEITDIRSTTG